MRQPGQLFANLQRKVETNQRIYFEFDPSGKHILSGSTNGSVTVWDLTQSNSKDEYYPTLSHFPGMHNDAINGLSCHPTLPYLATSSGQRHVKSLQFSDDEEDVEEPKVENSLKLWHWSALNQEEQ